ncbi:MAG: polysaccharide deacetylase family protein [Bacteroidales bacterium]|nr:polysaccharide deacetylase family protein [Bacteroidales bacterium]
MLAYKNVVLLLLACSLIIILLAWAFAFLNIWLVLALILLDIGCLIGGSFYVCSGLYLHAHCKGDTDKKQIAITFDDGPHADITPKVLDILKLHDIKAGFFLIGKNTEKNPEIVKRMLDEGHLIGNHSWSHSNFFGFWCTKKVVASLRKNEDFIEGISGKRTNLFRPPFGVTNPNIARAARLLDYAVTGWSIRSLDTMGKSNEKIIIRVVKRLKPGSVILFHDNHEGIIPILESVIKIAVAEGYTFISPDKLLNIEAYK